MCTFLCAKVQIICKKVHIFEILKNMHLLCTNSVQFITFCKKKNLDGNYHQTIYSPSTVYIKCCNNLYFIFHIADMHECNTTDYEGVFCLIFFSSIFFCLFARTDFYIDIEKVSPGKNKNESSLT